MENKVSLGSIAGQMAAASGKSKKLCDDFLKEFFRLAAEALLEGESLKVKGFGTFKLVEVDSRNSINVQTGEPQEIAAHTKVVFIPSKEMASAINAPFEEFESVEMEDDFTDDLLEYELESEGLSDEDNVSNARLEEGSDEEGEDDDFTLEAYENKEKSKITDEQISEPSIEEYNLEDSEEADEDSQNDSGEKSEEDFSKNSESIKEEPVVEEIQTEEPAAVSIDVPVIYSHYMSEEPRKSKFGLGFLTGALSTFAVCAVIFMLGCFFDWWPVNFMTAKEITQEQELTELAETPEETITLEEEKPPVYDVVTKTRYLTTIAREHYGNFNLWPYIYIENEDILGHPDRITPGTQVVVPDLSKYGVDPTSKEDINIAKKKAIEIYSRFNK